MTDREDTDEVLSAVSTAVLSVTRHLSVAEVLEVIVRSSRQLLRARYAALGIPDEGGGFAEFITDGISERQRAAIGPLPRQHGMLAALLHEGETIRSRDIRADARFGYFPTAHPNMTDFLGVPIRDGDETVGIIFLADKECGFTERDEALLTLFASHAAIALANARLYEQAHELSVVQERTRLARELHDAVSQKLFSLRLAASSARALAASDADAALSQLEKVESLAAEAARELREVIVELRPADLDVHGLAGTVRKHLRLVERLHAVRTEFTVHGDPGVPAGAELEVLRVIQEAVHNAVRHSHADLVRVTLCGGPEFLAEISDDGSGFDPGADNGGGLGIESMRERVAGVGGRLDIDASIGGGTTVRLAVPGV
ncbi:GAF domain-containing sensor histidine kinase [Stackebrandtia nassauensis]|uniref:Oxygen sensor histidine kinase NreB n=1 Tax=Stackebrandtia nassauensis (strain DSM 44728 / CIP 108903 / NRRL B-16338 / NBRC 102104 / LLR-40K-21) TaxID=446470 RepID=D3PXS3_STANL|nr:GAF domain-containing protein [Stackebrandtia nassauensis]ADD43403.1 GAF sensor signal transduction histidine kinase [Stackebrandtia nassauensis DSM 44728]